jgi:hypothetical protein
MTKEVSMSMADLRLEEGDEIRQVIPAAPGMLMRFAGTSEPYPIVGFAWLRREGFDYLEPLVADDAHVYAACGIERALKVKRDAMLFPTAGVDE